MSQLNGIIASILSDINEAKSKADETSREIAKNYASDQILRYFPVPRISIQNLEVEIKYAVNHVEEKPIQTAQSQKKLDDFVSAFAQETAKEVKKSVERVTRSNELYKGLSSVYPSEAWENEVNSTIKGVLQKSLEGNDPVKSSKLAREGLKKSLPELLPVVKKSNSLAIVPTETGEFQILGLDSSGMSEFVVNEKFADEKVAMNSAKELTKSLKANKVEVAEVKRDTTKKVETASFKAGNRKFDVSIDTKKLGAASSKSFFEKSVSEKAVMLNKGTKAKPKWMGAGAAANISSEEFEDDQTLNDAVEKVMAARLPVFETGVNKILSENKATIIDVNVDSEAISKAKPETISTIKFTLGSQDFTLLEDEDHNTIL
ncbi:hypothetical protein ACFOSV_02925 [Algoriphagus namhaensis]|uniref:Uncharacterized protein n=1 Tax=Algoriphagus namhaensis TaxID=915353 RepID=A0ABV8AMY7_9BACT